VCHHLGWVDYLSGQKYIDGGRNRVLWQRLGPEFSRSHLRRFGWWERFDLSQWNRIASPERKKIAVDSLLFTGKLYYELLALELCFEGGGGGRRVGDRRSDVLILGTAQCRFWRTTRTDTRLSPVARERERNRSLASVVTHPEVMLRTHPKRLATTTDWGHGTWGGTQGHRESTRRKANDRASVGDMERW